MLALFGLTDSQVRFLVTVMRQAGVFIGRQYAASAESRTDRRAHDFIKTLLVRRVTTSIDLGTTRQTRIIHVHCKPLYAAIGEPDIGIDFLSPVPSYINRLVNAAGAR